MKTYLDQLQEQQNATTLIAMKEPSAGGRATILDDRPSTLYQRKLRETMNAHTTNKTFPMRRNTPKGSFRFQQIATTMGTMHGVDTAGLVATHNSSFPGKLNAEATIQGNNIHFAPGMDTDYNIRHEVAHAIDNALNGTPKGNQMVNGQKVDTTREKIVDRMAMKALPAQAKTMGLPITPGISNPSQITQRKKVNDDSEKNAEASINPGNYVFENADNNWFTVIEQYKAGHLKYDKDDKGQLGHVNGMNRLLLYRARITGNLLGKAKEPVRKWEEKKRQEFIYERYGRDKKLYETWMKKEPIQPIKGDVPGSINPTSDIDVNLSGDGTEYAVQWLNSAFKDEYGHGREPGVVYDVNFYAQDFVPKKVFEWKENHQLDKKGNEKYYKRDDWRTHKIEDEDTKLKDEQEQEIASLLMMRVNMNDLDWAHYLDQRKQVTPYDSKDKIVEEVNKRFTKRNELINNNEDRDLTLTGDLAKMAPENRAYEKELVGKVALHRLRFKYANWKSSESPNDNHLKWKTDRTYKDLKAAKSRALTYANEAYYTQGAVIGVVVNKQMLDNMYENDRSTKYLKLKLTPAEYYHGFTEQIGFAFHGLDKSEDFNDLVRVGKYMHRAYNLFKHFCEVTGQDRDQYFTEKERRAASDWEGVKQGKEYNDTGYVDLTKNEREALSDVLNRYLGLNINLYYVGNEKIRKLKERTKDRLLSLKIGFDQAWVNHKN